METAKLTNNLVIDLDANAQNQSSQQEIEERRILSILKDHPFFDEILKNTTTFYGKIHLFAFFFKCWKMKLPSGGTLVSALNSYAFNNPKTYLFARNFDLISMFIRHSEPKEFTTYKGEFPGKVSPIYQCPFCDNFVGHFGVTLSHMANTHRQIRGLGLKLNFHACPFGPQIGEEIHNVHNHFVDASKLKLDTFIPCYNKYLEKNALTLNDELLRRVNETKVLYEMIYKIFLSLGGAINRETVRVYGKGFKKKEKMDTDLSVRTTVFDKPNPKKLAYYRDRVWEYYSQAMHHFFGEYTPSNLSANYVYEEIDHDWVYFDEKRTRAKGNRQPESGYSSAPPSNQSLLYTDMSSSEIGELSHQPYTTIEIGDNSDDLNQLQIEVAAMELEFLLENDLSSHSNDTPILEEGVEKQKSLDEQLMERIEEYSRGDEINRNDETGYLNYSFIDGTLSKDAYNNVTISSYLNDFTVDDDYLSLPPTSNFPEPTATNAIDIDFNEIINFSLNETEALPMEDEVNLELELLSTPLLDDSMQIKEISNNLNNNFVASEMEILTTLKIMSREVRQLINTEKRIHSIRKQIARKIPRVMYNRSKRKKIMKDLEKIRIKFEAISNSLD
ncbi:MAG: hypothetical protein ACRYGG_18710 [Janthinobacterium lividum]